MTTEDLVRSLKEIVARGKDGNLDNAYQGYRDLFASAGFDGHRPQDQRQAFRLMVMMKGAPRQPTAAMVEAHRAALAPLTELVSVHADPSDHELLGMCHVVLGDETTASTIFKQGLALERARDPSSQLCGTLMKRVSMV